MIKGKNFILTDLSDGLIKTSLPFIFYKKDKLGVIPTVVKTIFTERKKFKRICNILKLHEKNISPEIISERLKIDLTYIIDIIENEKNTSSYYDMQQYVRKILINSFYGVMGNVYFHFYNVDNAKAITAGGQNIIKCLSSGIKKYLIDKYFLKENPIIIIDTDSCYITFKEVLNNLKISFLSEKEKINYYLKFISEEINPVIDKILINYANIYNVDQLIYFKHEKIINKLAVIVKKHYIMEIIYDEGDIYNPPKMKYIGVQTVRSDTPEFCRGKLENLINMIFRTLDIKKTNDQIRKNKEEFFKEEINRIASTKGLNKYNEYVRPAIEYVTNGIRYPKHCPIQIKAAIAYNFLIERDKLPLMPSGKGVKIKFIYVNEQNIAQTNVIGFIGKWPKQFDKYFKIDYETQFEKTFMPIVEDLYKLLKWEDVQYEENILDDILS